MWSVCGQWRRGFTRTIKTDATFYLLNGREAERVALDRRRRHRALLACNDVLPPSRLLWWQARLSLFFLADVGGGSEVFLLPKQPLFVPLWIKEAEVVRRRRKPDFWCWIQTPLGDKLLNQSVSADAWCSAGWSGCKGCMHLIDC